MTDTDKGGRPAIGPVITTAYPRTLLEDIDNAATDAGLTRAAWLRRTAARALPETYEGPIRLPEWGAFFRGSVLRHLTSDQRKTVTAIREAATAGTLEVGSMTSQSSECATEATRNRASFITRLVRVDGEWVKLYQVTHSRYTTPSLHEEGTYSSTRRLFMDRQAAADWHEIAMETLPSELSVQPGTASEEGA